MSSPTALSELSNWPVLALVLAWIVGDGSTLQSLQGLPDGALGNAIFIFGAGASIGVHELVGRLCRRRSELTAAALSLVSNLVFAAVLLAAARAVYLAPGPDAAVRALAALVALNIVFTATNLLPALPFDGVRILSALVTGKAGRARLASRVTSACTEATAWLFLAFGLAAALADGPTAGIVWLLIGALVLREARSERRKLGAAREAPSSATTSAAASSGVRMAQ